MASLLYVEGGFFLPAIVPSARGEGGLLAKPQNRKPENVKPQNQYPMTNDLMTPSFALATAGKNDPMT
ncbi:MAG: hypothetical protein Q7T20_04550 [Saprospiraceae bacterium]|nr:hypothetical protein [Saprospiraceae bacterium]